MTITTPNVTFPSGTQTVNVTTGTSAKQMALVPRHPLIADEPVSVKITIKNVPDNCYLLHSITGTQRIATGLTVTVNGEATGAPTKTLWTPELATVIDQPNLLAGAMAGVLRSRHQ